MKFSFSAAPLGAIDKAVDLSYRGTAWNQERVGYLAVGLSVLLYVSWFALWPVKPHVKDVVATPIAHIALFFSAVALTIFVHELIHVAFAPNGLTSRNTVIGLDRKTCAFYSYVDGELSRNRAVVFVLAPFFLLTVVPTVLRFTTGLPTDWLGVVAICNSALSANDLIVGVYIALRVPKDAVDVQTSLSGVRYALKKGQVATPAS